MIVAKSSPAVANRAHRRYGGHVAANSATGCASPSKQKAHKRHRSDSWRFFLPAVSLHGGYVWDGFGHAGFLLPRSCTPARNRHQSCASDVGGSSAKGAVPMNHSRNPSAPAYTITHAAAWKARAFAALRADSSLSVRLARYNAAMARARALEAVGGAA